MNLRGLTPRFGLPAAFLLGMASMLAGPRIGGAAAPTTVAVVDIDAVLRSYAPAKEQQAAFGKVVEGIKAELDGLKGQVEKAAAELQNLEKGSVEYAKAAIDADAWQGRYGKMQEVFENDLGRRRVDLSVHLYEEISAGIAAFAAAKQIDVVLRARNAPANASISQRFDLNQARDVLWSGNQVDVTNDVITFLKGWTPPAAANASAEKH